MVFSTMVRTPLANDYANTGGIMEPMDEDLEARMRKSATRFKRTKDAYEAARTELNALIIEADAAGVGPSELARITGFTREWVAKVVAAEKRKTAPRPDIEHEGAE